jgi:hypothetical protein
MISRWHAIGFWLAAIGLLVALALPLSSETTPPLTARPALIEAMLAAAFFFAVAPRWAVLSPALGFLGTVLGCATTLALLRDTTIAGSASWGFWAITLATWLGAALTLTRLSALPAPFWFISGKWRCAASASRRC